MSISGMRSLRNATASATSVGSSTSIGREKDDVVPGGLGDRIDMIALNADVFRPRHDPQARVVKRADDLQRIVGGGVIQNEHLDVPIRLRERACDGLADERAVVVRGHDDRYQWVHRGPLPQIPSHSRLPPQPQERLDHVAGLRQKRSTRATWPTESVLAGALTRADVRPSTRCDNVAINSAPKPP